MEDSFNPGRVVAFSLAQSSPSEPGGQGGSLTGVSDQRRRAEELLVRTRLNNIEYFPPNFEGLVLGCIDADFCK